MGMKMAMLCNFQRFLSLYTRVAVGLLLTGAPVKGFILQNPNSYGGTFLFSFATTPGSQYVVQFQTSGCDGNWQDLMNVPASASGTVITVSDSGAAFNARRYYRVRDNSANQ